MGKAQTCCPFSGGQKLGSYPATLRPLLHFSGSWGVALSGSSCSHLCARPQPSHRGPPPRQGDGRQETRGAPYRLSGRRVRARAQGGGGAAGADPRSSVASRWDQQREGHVERRGDQGLLGEARAGSFSRVTLLLRDPVGLGGREHGAQGFRGWEDGAHPSKTQPPLARGDRSEACRWFQILP